MKTHLKHILLSAGTLFELACIAGIIVIVADMTWLLHDILTNGLSIWYGLIGSFMLIGLCMTVLVTVRHNIEKTKKLDNKTLRIKLDSLKKRVNRKNRRIS